jgi:large subunit ribosomal protein L4
MALSDRTSAGVIRVVQNLSLEKPSTKFAEGIVKKITPGKTLVVLGDGRTTPGVPTPLEKCFRNLPYVKALQVEGLNVKDILWSDYLLVDERALPKIWQRLEFPVRRRVNGE